MPAFPRHPLYTSHVERWREFRLAYEGGRAYIESYLFKHAKERNVDYKARLERAIYPNHIRAVVDTYAAHIYRNDIARSGEQLDAFWSDVDLLHTPASEFYERVAQMTQVQGVCAVVVDRYEPDVDVSTRAQELEFDRRPYAYAVWREDIVNWSVDRRGRFEWVAIREDAPALERGPLDEHDEERAAFRVWYPDRWELYVEESEGEGEREASVVLVDSGEHPVGEVPITLFMWGPRRGADPDADSAIIDLAPMNRRLFNSVSLIDEQLYQYAFSLLAMPKSTYDVLRKVDFGVSGGIPYADDVSKAPHYISPDVRQIDAIRSEIEKTESKIRMLSGLGRVNDETKSVRSGIALSYLTADKDALLSKFAARMARGEASVDAHVLAWSGVTDSDITRDYPTSFDPMDIEVELGRALQVVELGVTGEALYQTLAKAITLYLGDRLDGAQLQEVLDDLRSSLSSSSEAQPTEAAVTSPAVGTPDDTRSSEEPIESDSGTDTRGEE